MVIINITSNKTAVFVNYTLYSYAVTSKSVKVGLKFKKSSGDGAIELLIPKHDLMAKNGGGCGTVVASGFEPRQRHVFDFEEDTVT